MQVAEEPRRPRSSRRRARHRRLWLAAGIAAAGAVVAAATGDAAPTGLAGADAAYRAAYVFAVALACAHARRWTWPLVAGAAALAGIGDEALILGLGALAVATLAQLDRRRRQPVGAAVGVLAAIALLRLPAIAAFGVPSLVAAVAPVPAVASALASVRRRTRRAVLLGAGAVAAAAVVVVAAAGVGALVLRGDAEDGVDAARSGLDALRDGDTDAAAGAFAVAAASFGDAHDRATAWWMAPARAVPVVGRHLAVARTLAEEGARLADVSARTAPAVSLDDLTAAGGVIRVDRIAELAPLATEVHDALTDGQARLGGIDTGWLLAPLVDALDELRAEVDSSVPDAALAVTALDAAPDLLGAERPRRYLVLFGNPAEARELGGFVSSAGMLVADGGRLTFTSIPDAGVLERQLADVGAELGVDVPAAFRSSTPERYVRTWTDSPDIATIADVVANLYPQLPDAGPVDGVLYLDPYVLAALLELTGPVTIPETGEVVSAEGAVDYVLRGQYLSDAFDPGRERKERLGDAGEIAFDRLLEAGLPRPRALADLLSPLVRARRLLFATTDAATMPLLEEVGLAPPVEQPGTDTILVTHGNRRANKLDAYLTRALDHRVEVADDGAITSTLTVTLANEAPSTGLVPYQTGTPLPGDVGPEPVNHLTLHVYSQLAETAISVDGQPAAYSEAPAHGLRQYSIPVSVPAGATVEVEVRLEDRRDPGERCTVTFLPNASAAPDVLSLTVVGPAGTKTTPRQVLDEPVTLAC